MSNYAPNDQTTDAVSKDHYLGIAVVEDSLCRLPVYVFASDHAGNVSLWVFNAVIRRVGSADPTMLLSVGSHNASSGAVLWTATVVIINGALYARIAGGIATIVDWLCTNDDIVCMAGAFGS